MKALLLLLALTPFTASAATDVSCDSQGGFGDLKFTLVSEQGILATPSLLRISAQGMQLTSFNTVVEQTSENTADKIVVKIKSLQADGTIDPEGVEATIQLATRPGPYRSVLAAGAGVINVTKKPREAIGRAIRNQYSLSNCAGFIAQN